jgi:hypothetical protein
VLHEEYWNGIVEDTKEDYRRLRELAGLPTMLTEKEQWKKYKNLTIAEKMALAQEYGPEGFASYVNYAETVLRPKFEKGGK